LSRAFARVAVQVAEAGRKASNFIGAGATGPKPAYSAANGYVPSDTELARFHGAHNNYGEAESYFNPLRRHVTGRSTLANPSTDDLVQWTAHKWGIPEDVIRAQMAVESWWRQSDMGDLTTESDPGAFPAFSCPNGGPPVILMAPVAPDYNYSWAKCGNIGFAVGSTGCGAIALAAAQSRLPVAAAREAGGR